MQWAGSGAAAAVPWALHCGEGTLPAPLIHVLLYEVLVGAGVAPEQVQGLRDGKAAMRWVMAKGCSLLPYRRLWDGGGCLAPWHY